MNLATSSLVCFLVFSSWTGGNAQFNNCTDGTIDWIANGRCDPVNNNDPCDYDGGDCCHCDCVDGADFICGDDGYSCIDPTSECTNPSAAYPNCSQYWTVGDGTCDWESNSEVRRNVRYYTNVNVLMEPRLAKSCTHTPPPYVSRVIQECAYDGGDCCQCDFTNSSEYTSSLSYTTSPCLDPTSNCVLSEFPDCSGILGFISDGFCDYDNNNQVNSSLRFKSWHGRVALATYMIYGFEGS